MEFLNKFRDSLAFAIAAGGSAFFLLVLEFFPLDVMLVQATFIFIVCILALLTRPSQLPFLDWLEVAACAVAYLYTAFNAAQLQIRLPVTPEPLDLLFGALVIAIALDAARRSMGVVLTGVGLVVIAYAFFGQYLPGVLWHPRLDFSWIVGFLYSLEGIYGVPVSVTVSYVFVFVIFGAFLETAGAGKFFLDLSKAIVGSSRGGPAKMAVVASALFGSINGSPAANVVSTGVFTIPVMKKVGYTPTFAGAVEAVASTGGQMLPPIMGASAFLMAQIIGVPYAQIALAALIPALVYFFAVYVQVDCEAFRLGLQPLPKHEVPRLGEVLRQGGHLLVPLLVLIYVLLIRQASPIQAGVAGIVSCVLVSWIKRDTRMGLGKILSALRTGGMGIVGVGAAVAVASMIVGVFTMTGLGLELSNIIVSFAGGVPFLALVLTAVVSLLLGIGMPTTGAYLITAASVTPALVQMGFPVMGAHLFSLYFANISNVTPPVALACFAAAGIAGADPLRIGTTAFRLAMAGFLIPFVFVYAPGLLLAATTGEVVWVTLTTLIGVYALALALEGYWPHGRLPLIFRLVVGAGGILAVVPEISSDVVGIVVVAGTLAVRYLLNKKVERQVHSRVG